MTLPAKPDTVIKKVTSSETIYRYYVLDAISDTVNSRLQVIFPTFSISLASAYYIVYEKSTNKFSLLTNGIHLLRDQEYRERYDICFLSPSQFIELISYSLLKPIPKA